jgi:tRNA nucleotidyltransferase/poly(A) polymerase
VVNTKKGQGCSNQRVSSVGRTLARQVRGRWFDPSTLYHVYRMSKKIRIKKNNKLEDAISAVKEWKSCGYESYLTGELIRDMMLGINDLDNDVSITVIGVSSKRINELGNRLVAGKSFETNFSNNLEEDAKQRDFTINALYYKPAMGDCECLRVRNVKLDHDCSLSKAEVLDPLNAKEDLEKKIIKTINDPKETFKKDKLGIIRAIRIRSQLNNHLPLDLGQFTIEEKTWEAIKEESSTFLSDTSYEKVWKELDKMSKNADFQHCIASLVELGILKQILPELDVDNELIRNSISCLAYLPVNAPTLVKVMTLIGSFERSEVLEIVKRFKLKSPNWI